MLPKPLALGLALIALAMCAPTAAAATPRDFFGVQSPSTLDAPSAERMAEARVGTLRMGFYWKDVEHTRGRYDWAWYDDAMERSARAGVEVIAVLVGSPRWIAPRYNDPPRTPEARAEWAAFVQAAVRRYGSGGEFWSEHPEVPYKPIRFLQVWNEPNLKNWWANRPSAREYLMLLRATQVAARAADPAARVMLAGLPSGTRGRIPATTYLGQLYRSSRSAKEYFDYVAIHPYASSYRGVVSEISRARSVMRRYRDSRTYLWVTESGWASSGPRTAWTTSAGGQASHLSRTFSHLARHRGRYRVRGVVWYTWRDEGNGDWWGERCGLFDRAGEPKRAWWQFRRLTQSTVE